MQSNGESSREDETIEPRNPQFSISDSGEDFFLEVQEVTCESGVLGTDPKTV